MKHVAVGATITAEHLEIVRKYLGPPGPGEVVTAAMVNRAIDLDRDGAVPFDDLDVFRPDLAAEQRRQGLEPAAERRQSGGTWRPGEGPIDWSQVTVRPEGDDQPVRFPPASVLDPEPADRLQDTVRDVRDRRTAGITVPVRVDPDPQLLRITALHAAAQVYAGKGGSWGTDTVLQAADDYAAWLATGERPDRFPAEAAPPDPGMGIRR